MNIFLCTHTHLFCFLFGMLSGAGLLAAVLLIVDCGR